MRIIKITILTFTLVSLYVLAIGQINSGKAEYVVELKLDRKSSLDPNVYSSVLYFSDLESVTEDDGISLTKENNGGLNTFTDLSNNSNLPVYKNFKTNEMVSQGFVLDKLFRVCEPIPSINWTLTSNKKEIEGITCLKALGHFRGREYVAWYAPKIPVNNGPWKFGGLPGLIFEITDTSNEVKFNLTKISLGLSKNELKRIRESQQGRKITFDQYFDLWDKKAENLNDFLSAELNDLQISSQVFRIEKCK